MAPDRTRNRTRTAATLVVLFVVAAIVCVIATQSGPLQPSMSPSTEIDLVSPTSVATREAERISETQEESASAPVSKPKRGGRTAETKAAMVGLLGAWREAAASALVEHGLAPEDSERRAQQ